MLGMSMVAYGQGPEYLAETDSIETANAAAAQ
jgi:hypothetical protein